MGGWGGGRRRVGWVGGQWAPLVGGVGVVGGWVGVVGGVDEAVGVVMWVGEAVGVAGCVDGDGGLRGVRRGKVERQKYWK